MAVSLQDGMVYHLTKTVSNILGYPEDMWIERSFLKFVHPKDRAVLNGQPTKTATFPGDNMSEDCTPAKN